MRREEEGEGEEEEEADILMMLMMMMRLDAEVLFACLCLLLREGRPYRGDRPGRGGMAVRVWCGRDVGVLLVVD